MRGWLAVIAKEKSALRQVVGYRELVLQFEFYEAFEIVPFDEAAARLFDELRRQKLRIGSRDLKIAATALVNDALLLSANLTDFETSARLAGRELAGVIVGADPYTRAQPPNRRSSDRDQRGTSRPGFARAIREARDVGIDSSFPDPTADRSSLVLELAIW